MHILYITKLRLICKFFFTKENINCEKKAYFIFEENIYSFLTIMNITNYYIQNKLNKLS